MIRDFAGYGAEPPHAGWPGNARIAVNFVINFEEGSELSYPAGDGVSQALPLLERALALEPDFALAHSHAAVRHGEVLSLLGKGLGCTLA